MRRSRTTALVAAGTLLLAGAGIALVRAQTAAAKVVPLKIGVSSVQYDSPGAVVPSIVTVYNVPAGYAASVWATGTAGAVVTCRGSVWLNRARQTASRLCYLQLPDKAGTYNLIGSGKVIKGSTVRRVSAPGARAVKADGKPSPIRMTPETILQIERCQNTTKNVWLTFDDGGSAAQVTSILATLKRNNVKGIFFFRGDWATKNPALLTTITAAGHLLGNHTATHKALSRLSSKDVLNQLAFGTAATGTPKLLRPPFGAGAFTTKLQQDVLTKDYQLCRWTTDTYDWDGPTVKEMVERISVGDYRSPPISAGGNILMHGHGKFTAPGLQAIIDAVRAKKLTLQPLKP
jgi:peptidoglycan/xylan/chitin deacetylase (PgdA/CDA1 family)